MPLHHSSTTNYHQGPDKEADGNDGDQVKGEDNEGEITMTGQLEHKNGDNREWTKGLQWDKDKDIGE